MMGQIMPLLMPIMAELFDRPIPGVWNAWPWLILPLCASVALVYKAIHVENMRRVPLEALQTTLWIAAGMVGVAAGLWLIVEFVNRG
jgi:hypothetical protein